ncbi:Bifunctional transcriptional activator/DNA repair enzyme AdaA [compost metagenome]
MEVSPEEPYERSIFYVDPLAAEELLRAFPVRRARFEALCRDSSGNPHAYDLKQDAQRMEWVFDSYEQAHSGGKGEDPEELTLFFLQFLEHLPRAAFAGSGPTGQPKPLRGARYSERVMSWIEAHYHEKISMDQLAAALHLSNNYISRIFREETGGSISDYLIARRIKQACRLLDTTDLPVSLIADTIGYDNPSYFIHLFKKVMGVTPLKYRSAHSRTRS